MIGPLFLIAGCIGLEAGRELCFKLSAAPVAIALGNRAWAGAAANPMMWGGIAFWAAEMLLWIVTLEYMPLGLAFPLMALTYAVTPLAGRILLGERLAGRQVAGIVLIVAGAAYVGATGL